MVKKDIFYKVFLGFILLVPIAISSIEVTISFCLLLSLFFLLDVRFKYSTPFSFALLPLLGIFLIALGSTFMYNHETYDIIKDFVYLIKPVLFIWLGFYLTGKIHDKEYIYKVIFILAAFFALLHLAKIGFYTLERSFSVSINLLRYAGGKANYIELLALVLLHLRKDIKPYNFKWSWFPLLKLLLYVSFIFYFSRTMLVGILVLYLSIYGYTKLTSKGVTYLSIFLGATTIFFAVLLNMDLDRSSEGIEGFFYKIQNAPAEIFTTDIDIENHANLWDHWRGYEANKAFTQLDEAPHNYGYFLGKGMGSLVDLGFEAPLNTGGIQYIPITHNGFAYIAFKSGFIGVFLYLLFLIHLYLQAYKKGKNKKGVFFNHIISGIGISLFFTTLIITGAYNARDVLTIVLGSFLFLQYYNKKESLTP